MPKYVLFLIAAHRADAEHEKDETDKANDGEETEEDLLVKKVIQEFLKWSEAELKAERIQRIDFLRPSSSESSIRVDFHKSTLVLEGEPEKKNGEPDEPLPENPSVTGEHQTHLTKNVLGYYTAEFPTKDEVVAWAKTCPLSYDGFAVEIRELQDAVNSIGEAPTEVKEWAGNQIVHTRRQLMEQGKMKMDEDGTLWVKVEDEEPVKELIAEAEKREEEHNEE